MAKYVRCTLKNVKVGDRVFWFEEGDNRSYQFYSEWATPWNVHPTYPDGYLVLSIDNNTLKLQSHHTRGVSRGSVTLFQKLVKKAETSLDKEIEALESFGYRNG